MNAFDVADMLSATESNIKRAEIVEKYLEPIDFPREAELGESIGYVFYGIIDGMVISCVDGTWMINERDALVRELKILEE